MSVLGTLSYNGYDGVAIFASYIFASIAADGRMTEEEYLVSYPLIRAFFENEITYEDCKKAAKSVKSEKEYIKKAEEGMLRIFGILPEEIQNEIIIISMMICAVDGKISHKEKNRIKKLAEQ